MPPTRDRTERPREPLLQLGIGFLGSMCRIGGRLRSAGASPRGVVLEIPPFESGNSNHSPSSGLGTVSGGQFDWGGRLPKCNGGARR